MYLVVEFNIMVNNMDRKNLEFASLLHDIGKFYQRTGDKVTGKYSEIPIEKYGRNGAHAKWSAYFISKYWDDDVVDLALYHHQYSSSNYPKLANMLTKADHHSSTERIFSEEANDTSLTPLISIFSEVKIGDNKESEECYVPFKKIDLNEDSFEDLKPKISPKETMSGWNLKPEYKQLWTEFTNEVNNLKRHDFNTTLALMKKYTSTIPSAVYVSIPDISLYDHSKTTAALAVCRYLFDRDSEEKLTTTTNDQKVYLAINGDISGIQKFIFKISSPQEAQSGMSKRLRGRSLYLTLLTNAIADKIAQDLELTSANILFCGGGRFTIIAPNTEKAKAKLEEIKEKINKEFIDKFNAELYLAIATEEACAIKKDPKNEYEYDLNNFGKLMKHLTDLLTEDKKHKFVNNLEDVFKFEDEIKYDDICSVCGNLYHKNNEDDFVCPSCKSHEDLGQKVSNSNYMIKVFLNDEYDFKDAKKDFAFYDEYLSLGYNFFKSYKSGSDLIKFIDELDMFSDKFEVIKLNDTNFLEFANEFDELSLEKISFSFSFLANTVPKHPKEGPLYFEHLAQISKGSNKLGVLKMDVDNLGQVFNKGFDELIEGVDGEHISGMSISRMSTLSSQLDLFFSGFVNEIASNYVVYSDISALNLDDDSFNKKFKPIDLKLQNDKIEDEFITIFKAKSELDLKDKITLKRWEIPTIHINYSGGDDLLVLGPYDDIIKFARELRSKFKEWTCNNDSINLSGGISIVSPKFPIGKAANMAEDYLDASKSCGKDKICLFGEVVDWGDNGLFKGFNSLLEFGLELEDYNKESKVSKGLIYSMLNIWKSTFEHSSDIIDNENEWNNVNTNRLSTKSFVPLFKHKLRLINDKKVRKDLDKKGVKLMPWIKIPVSWVSLRMRKA
ncbi:CRISPR-associated protein Csm1 [Methanobrevibacter olleyae]|uniref:CRISPR system single-strand-specific deoxyribonuclease Cas10/Csm1 (subtype III-A) n=2 Tax=Methanobrevibacter olleyae TaxID=294671 RepID=A0A1I4KNQ5_METOL|nr:CRISPR-associated protein Csm1 [Methanobrevibacter olleyae]